MSDFDFECECADCPFFRGTAVLTQEWLDNFSCPCHSDSNCSYLDNARIYVDEVCNDSSGD